MDRDYILGKEKIQKSVLKISSPSAISTVSTVIYNIIDTIFIGRYVFSIGIAAVSLYLPIQMMISSISMIFASGVGSFISRQLGKKNIDKAEKAVGTLVAFILTISIILCIIGLIFTKDIVELFGARGNAIYYSSRYAEMMFIGILFNPLCLASNNVMRGEGSTKYSMIGTVISIISNIFLDFIFIVIFKWGVLGAGLATTIAKLINLLYVIYCFKFKTLLKVKLKYIKYDFKLIKECLPIGFSTFLNQFAGSISIMLLNNDLYHFGGNYVIAVYGIVFKLTSIIQKSVAGFNRGNQPLIGYNFGANNIKRVKEAVKWGFIFSTGVALIGTILIMIFSKPLSEMFTTKLALINYSSKILIIALLASPFLGIYFLSISFYRAIGRAKESIILSLFRRVIFFIPLLYILPYGFNLGLEGIWIVLPLSNFISALFAGTLLLGTLKTLKVN